MAVFLPEIKSVILKQELKGSQNHLVDGTYSSHPGGSDDKRIHMQCRRPGFERSPGEGHGNPLQYSCQENSMDRGAWQATVHWITKNQKRLSEKDFHILELLK